MPKNETTAQGELERHKEQFDAAFTQVMRLAFGLPDTAGALDNLQKVLDDMPPSAAEALSINIGSMNKTIQRLREAADPTGQMSLFPDADIEKAVALEAIPHLMSMIPRDHLMPNHKLVNELTKDLVGAGRTSIRVSPEKAKKPVRIICDLAYDTDKIQLSSRQPFTEYDRNVYNAVTSLFVYGDRSHIVTPAIVYRAMTGMHATEDPSPQQIGAVTKSLNKMSCIRAKVDCTQELKARRLPLNQGDYILAGQIETYLLNTTVLHVETGGRVIRAYKIEKTPILYAYSNALSQVPSVPTGLLDIKAIDAKTGQITTSRVANTESRIAIKGYLLRRIEGMKNPKNKLLSRSIALQSYERDGRHHAGLYEIGGNATPTKTEAGRIRDYVTVALSYWKATGYIKGYEWIKRGKQTVSVEILL